MSVARILVCYFGYLPGKKYGGPVTSLYRFTELVGDCYDLYFVTTDHDLGTSERYDSIEEGWNQVGKCQVCYLKSSELKMKKYLELVEQVKPDLVYISSFFGASFTIPFLKIAKNKCIPVLIAPRGEFAASALKMKSWKKTPYLWLMKKSGLLHDVYFQATSKNEEQDICRAMGGNGKIVMLPNIPCTFRHKEAICKKAGSLRILVCSRILRNKNILKSIGFASKLNGKVEMDIYGSIEDEQYWDECKKAIMDSPSSICISYKGTVSPQEAAELPLSYDCLLHPTEFENYGQVIVESIVHDCPVIISKGTTPWDDLEKNGAGFVRNLNSDSDFVNAVDLLLKMDNENYIDVVKRTREYAKKKIDLNDLMRQYTTSINRIIGGENINTI